MTFERKDLIQDIATSTGTGAFTMANTPPLGMQAFSVHTIGATFRYRAFAGSQWEIGTGTLTDPTHIARSVRKSSNADALVNFMAAPTVIEVVDSADVLGFLSAADGIDVGTLGSVTPVTGDLLLLLRGGSMYTVLASSLGSVSTDTIIPGFGNGAAMTSSSITQTGFTLAWPAATDNVAVAGYETSTDGGTTYANAGNVLTRAITGLTAGTTYQARVRAYDAAGNRSAALSLSVLTSASSDTTLPTMSGSLTTASVTSSGYVMNWTAGSDNVAVTGYETSTDGGASWLDVGNVLTRTVSTAAAGTLYNLRVRCYDAAGNRSTPPLSATVTTLAGQQITVNTPATQTVGTPYNVTGTYANGTPAALDYSIDGGATWTAATSPTIGSGAFSFSVTPTTASASRTMMVRDHTTLVSGTSGEYAVNAAAATPLYVARTTVTPGGAAIAGTLWTATPGTFAGSTGDKHSNAASGPRIQAKRISDGIAPENLKWVWGSSPSSPPTGVTYASTDLPIGATDNDEVHTANVLGSSHYGSWVAGQTTHQYYGVFSVSGSLFAWRRAANAVAGAMAYLWLFPDDGSAPFVYDNGTGTPIGWQMA